MNSNQIYQDLLDKIDELQPNYFGFEQVIYTAMELLNHRKDFDIIQINEWLADVLNNYSHNEAFDRILKKIDEVISNDPSKENEFLSDGFLLEETDYKWDLDKCCEYLGVLNPIDWIENYVWFEDWLKHKNLMNTTIQDPTLPNAQPYEIMAILALYYAKEALDYNDDKIQTEEYYKFSRYKYTEIKNFLHLRKERAVREVICALNAINKAKEWKYNISFEKLEKNITKKH